MATMKGAPAAGLRERKKLRTRTEISDVATRLFAEHGFEEVTLSQIAEAADVSIKTIFNYFGSKEDLYFDRAEEFREAFVSAIVDREPGTTVLEALRTLLTENFVPSPGTGWAALADPERAEQLRRFMQTQDRSPALRARRLMLSQELAERLTEVLPAELGLRPDDPTLRAFVAMLVAALELRATVLREGITEQVVPKTLRHRVVAVVDEAFDRLSAAFADVDRAA